MHLRMITETSDTGFVLFVNCALQEAYFLLLQLEKLNTVVPNLNYTESKWRILEAFRLYFSKRLKTSRDIYASGWLLLIGKIFLGIKSNSFLLQLTKLSLCIFSFFLVQFSSSL